MPRAVLAGAALLVLASGATQSDPLVPFHPVERRNRSANQGGTALAARTKGRPDAPVTVYEMSDFQCPYCRAFALGTMPLLERERRAGATSTPTFYIEGALLEGAAPVTVFRAVLDSIYQSKTAAGAR